MRTKFSGILTLLLAFVVQLTFAQEKTISGTVADDTGLPLPGVNILIKGTNTGTQSDFDGNYTINASVGQTLVYSYVGFQNIERPVTAATVRLDVRMQAGEELDAVVVTAQGISREKKSLGYAVTTIESESFAGKPSTDVARALTGKAPGVQIQQTSGLSGSGTNIIIRGFSSFSGSNQPLFVVDGVPFNSETNNDRGFTGGATTASSRFLDLDPNQIESISILKGLSATTLYGNAGRNGVVLVTTKNSSGKQLQEKMSISLAHSNFFTEIASLPEYQDTYGNGFFQNYSPAFSNWGPSFTDPGNASGIAADGTIPHWYASNSAFPEFAGVRVPYQPHNNVEPFFGVGHISTTSLNVAGRTDDGNTSYNVGFGHTNDEGFMEGNKYKRINFSMGGNTKLSNKFSVSSTMQFSFVDKLAPPTAAAFGSNPTPGQVSAFSNIFYTPRSFDLFSVPFQNPITGESVNYRADIQNPRWTLKNASETEDVRRFTSNVSVLYDLNDWSSLSYRVGFDTYNQKQVYGVNRGGPQLPGGTMVSSFRINNTWDHTFSYNFRRGLGEDFTMDGILGLNPRLEQSQFDFIVSNDQFIFDLMRHGNFENSTSGNFKDQGVTVGAFFSGTIDYKRFVYLNLQARNDWFSSLERENRSLFYPSASLSFDATQAFESLRASDMVNFLKLRVGYGTSAGFPDLYQTRNVLGSSANVFINPYNGGAINVLALSGRLGNAQLKPELHEEIEIGLEGTFFKNRLTVDLSLYDKTSTDLLLPVNLDPATGFTSQFDNVGEINNKGIELSLNAKILRPKVDDGFAWNITSVYTLNENEVIKLNDGAESRAIAGFGNLGNFAVPGRPYGVIYGSAIQRDGNGNFIVGANGSYLATQDAVEIGDPNADWRGTLINEFSFKGFTFQFQLEYQHGGDMYSTTASALLSRGLLGATDFDRTQTFILPGVLQNGNINDIQIAAAQYGFENSGFFIDEHAIYDATNLKLREVSLTYQFPKRILDRTPFGSLSLSFLGQNLWFKAFNFPDSLNFDPEVNSLGVGNGQGFDFFTGPTAKMYGLNLNLTF